MYIIANKRNGTIYTGVTSNLKQRISQHKSKAIDGFSKEYNVTKLVYFEQAETMYVAMAREKQLKAGSRKKKLALIEKMNPTWKDLFDEL